MTITFKPDLGRMKLPEVVYRMRQAGIPVRLRDDEIRLLDVYQGEVCIGKGVLTWLQREEVFVYEPPATPDVIDVEARVIVDLSRLT